MSEPQIDIRPDHWAIVRDILQRHVPQYAVWAFGSRAKWMAKQYSDLDLAIITDSPLPLATSGALAEDFSESDLPWKVDIVDWAETSETFRKIIERDRVVVQEVWPEVPLSELTATPATYGVVQPGKSTLDGVPMLRVNNFQNDSVNLTDVMRIAPEIEEKYERTRIQAGDVLLTIVGSVGQVAIASEELAGWNIARAVAMIRPKSADLSRWISFALRSPQAQHQLGVTANTTVQTTINLKDLRELKIPFPKEKDRRAITQILGSLDDRIELNRQMNETLETMARSLFKAWFVDFDGVPEEDMKESELGLIPSGWRVGKFEELLVLQRGFDLPTQARIAGQFPVIAAGGINGTHNEPMVKGPGVVTGRSGVLGNVYFELGDFWPLNTTLWVKEFRIAKPCYAYELLRGFDFKLFNSGSAVPTLNRNHIHHLPQIIPPAEIINDFEKEAMALRHRIDSNERESQQLAQLRDTLLPKLISGEVRIKDAERLAETA